MFLEACVPVFLCEVKQNIVLDWQDMRSVSVYLCPLGPPEHPNMNFTLQHVFSMWASGLCACVRVYVCVCVFVIDAELSFTIYVVSFMIWHNLFFEHFPVSSEHCSLCLCTWKLMKRSICYPHVYVECVCMCVCV